MNNATDPSALPPETLHRLVDLLTEFGKIETYQQRLAFLASAGLTPLQSKLPLDGTTDTFVQALIRESRLVGTFTAGGEPAFFILLGYLQEQVAGHPDHVEFVAGLRRAATPPVTRADTLPPASLDFTGRDAEMTRITAALRQGRPVMISGMGGIGKSDLARKVAEKIRADFPGAALQVELQPDNKPVTAAEVVGTLILALQPATKLPDTLAERVAVLRPLMQGQKGILLLDNAAAHEQVQPLEAVWRGWAVLITSRARWVVKDGRTEQLGPLEAAKAEQLVRTLTENFGRSLTQKEAEAVAQTCHYHPLALHVASAYIGTLVNRSVANYVAKVKDAPMSTLVSEDYANVAQVLGVSIKQLHEANPKVCDHWHLLALMPDTFDAGLAGALLGELKEGKLGGLDIGSLSPKLVALFNQLNQPSVTPLGETTTKATLDTLVRLNLLETIPPPTDHEVVRYRLHDFLTDYALHHSPHRPVQVAQDKSVRCHALTVLQRGSDLDGLYREGKPVEALLQFDALWNHLNGAWRRLSQADDAVATFVVEKFADWMINLLLLRLTARTQISYQEVALHAARARNDRSNEAAHLGNLGNAYGDLGEVRTAIGYYEQALAIAREIGDKRMAGSALGSLGGAYADSGEVRTAIGYYEQALVISREIGDKRGEGKRLGNLGVVYFNLSDTSTSMKYIEQALSIAKEIGDKHGEGNQLGNLGEAYAKLGDVHTAIYCYEQALAIRQVIGDRRGEGNDCWNLALVYEQEGERDQAIAYARAALALYEATEHPDCEKVRTQLREWENGS